MLVPVARSRKIIPKTQQSRTKSKAKWVAIKRSSRRTLYAASMALNQKVFTIPSKSVSDGNIGSGGCHVRVRYSVISDECEKSTWTPCHKGLLFPNTSCSNLD